MVLGEGSDGAVSPNRTDGLHQWLFREDQSCPLLPSAEGWPDERLTPWQRFRSIRVNPFPCGIDIIKNYLRMS